MFTLYNLKIYTFYFLVALSVFSFTGCVDSSPLSNDDVLPVNNLHNDMQQKVLEPVVAEIPLVGAVPTPYAAPALEGLTNWVNSEPITSLENLRGKVVLIDFWTYDCINCIRTLPHIQALHEKYGDEGLVILGVHAPEFSYERKIENVKAAAIKHGLTYAIVQDNDFTTWRNYKNRYWPAHYLIDKEGFVRATHFGEGAYEETDRNVARLLAE